MGLILKIKEKFKLTSRGTIYVTDKLLNEENFHMGDILCDLSGNRFQITGIDLFRGPYSLTGNISYGLLLKPLGDYEVRGKILVDENTKLNFLFCNHVLYPKKVDEDYLEEYQEASVHHNCSLLSFEDLEAGKLTLAGSKIEGLTIYRGWMMKPEMYKRLYDLLLEQNIMLVNTPEEYERYHTLPGWYKDFEDKTAYSVWTNGTEADILIQKSRLMTKSCIVKDFVKSRKHEWESACFIPDIRDTDRATNVIKTFVSRQGDSLTGGLVLREYLHLKKIGTHEKSGMPLSEEYRVFVLGGSVLTIDGYWNHEEKLNLSEDEYRWIEEIASEIKSSFVTIDLARKEDGKLVVMELGDGQVSGLQEISAKEFYSKIVL